MLFISTVLEQINPNEMFKEKYKFEVKTAKEIKTRLDDVKGIDEIKAEV